MALASLPDESSGLRRRTLSVTVSGKGSDEIATPESPSDSCANVTSVPLDGSKKPTMLGAGARYLMFMIAGILIGLACSPRLLPLQSEALEEQVSQSGEQLYDESLDDMFDGLPRYNDPHDPHYAESDLLIRSANRSQPLLQYLDDALTDGEFADLQNCLRDHPMRHSNVNNADTFGATKGFIVSFNEEGIEQVANHEHFSCLMPFFQRHRLPVANAWILNMVWAEVPKYDREFAIERHTDDALEMDYPGAVKVLPYQTSVLYMFLPEDMEGGEIEAYPYEMEQEDMMQSPPHGRVTPKLNRMAYFRGDAWHQVRSYKTKAKDVLRASLVLENYHIPMNLENYIVPFSWHDGRPEMM